MKKIYFALASLFLSGLSMSQPLSTNNLPAGKIILANGQKIVVESSTVIEASLTMGMELNSSSATVNTLEVKSVTDKNYTLTNTLTKMKVTMNMMGQPTNYDSENKEGNNADIAKIFDEKLNKPVEIIIDNTTGKAIEEKKKGKQTDPGETNPADDLMKMFSDNSDDAVVSGAFERIPPGIKTGDSWSDTTLEKDMKLIRNYTLRSVTGNEATIQLDINSTSVNKLNFQEMEFEVKSETKTKSEIFTDINTGLVKKRTASSDISGSIQVMGQDMPISAKVSSSGIYH